MLHIIDVLQALKPGMGFTSVEDAYFHIPVAHHHRRFLCIMFQGRTHQYRVLPFGLSLSPHVFTQCIQVTLEPLQQEGMLILLYLDDLLLCVRSPQQAANNTHRLLEHATALGLRVNLEKLPHSVLVNMLPGVSYI